LPIGRKIARTTTAAAARSSSSRCIRFWRRTIPGHGPHGSYGLHDRWATHQYWWRYLVTLDKEWLRSTGYPMMRDCALFYTDFMKKRADGCIMLFRPIRVKTALPATPRITRIGRSHAACAILSPHHDSRQRGARVDEDLRAAWRERLEHAAGDDGRPPLVLSAWKRNAMRLTHPSSASSVLDALSPAAEKADNSHHPVLCGLLPSIR